MSSAGVDELFEPLPGEGKADQLSKDDTEKNEKEDRVRSAIADVYTFVRTRNLNKNIAAFTFDHYIDEALRDIRGSEVSLESGSKQGRAIRDAAGQAFDVRPSKLEELEKLKQTFLDNFDAAMKMAIDSDDETEGP